jgi:hypothetical protein
LQSSLGKKSVLEPFPQVWISCGKQSLDDLSLAFGLPASNFCLLAPDARRAVLPDVVGPLTAVIQQRGIVSDWRFMGKGKVRKGPRSHAHDIHNFSTSPRIVQLAARRDAGAFVFTAIRNSGKNRSSKKGSACLATKFPACGKEQQENS